MKTDYLHGFSPQEQDRLIRQADYWRHLLIATDLDYRAGQTVLDIGCGAGAVLGVLWQEFPGIRLAGIDLESRQIAFARHHLASLGVGEPDLRVGQASRLPWKDESVDHVYMMWFLEHMADCRPVLSEAWREYPPGQTARRTEGFPLYSASDCLPGRVFPPRRFCVKSRSRINYAGRVNWNEESGK